MSTLIDWVFRFADDIITYRQKPDVVYHFHHIVGSAVDPEIEVTFGFKGVIFIEAGKGNDFVSHISCCFGSIDYIGRFATWANKYDLIAIIAV